ncbi:MAG: hypothetical protein F6K22_34925 [Okeania sp. SIO2F4]|uniref:hypothetical protein n=1 Tax=Okeania sp. SIO2F4 TaxID=2607790 RepID=UPI00142A1DE3|nr:hypothetical protein [Okeania sp. SIO2F4]NES07533.1 hypothetical protein [Okeania sp. SIO2F4]
MESHTYPIECGEGKYPLIDMQQRSLVIERERIYREYSVASPSPVMETAIPYNILKVIATAIFHF